MTSTNQQINQTTGGFSPMIISDTNNQCLYFARQTNPFNLFSGYNEAHYSYSPQRSQFSCNRFNQPQMIHSSQRAPQMIQVPQAPSVIVRPNSFINQTSDETNKRIQIKDIEENRSSKNCIKHFVEGQIILETHKPMSGKNRIKQGEGARKRKKSKHLPHGSLLIPQPKKSPYQNHQEAASTLTTHHQSKNHHSQVNTPSHLSNIKVSRFNESINSSSQSNPQTQYTLKPQLSPFSSHIPMQQIPIKRCENQERIILERNYQEKIRLRSMMPKWSIEEVAKFIEGHETIKQYSTAFKENEIDGQALLLAIDKLPDIQHLLAMVKIGPAIKIEHILSKYKMI